MFLKAITTAVFLSLSGLWGQTAAGDPPKLPQGTVITHGQSLIIVTPPSKKLIYGYSVPKGRLDAVRFRDNVTGDLPVTVGFNVACTVVGKTAYAFGAEGAQWATIELDEAAPPTVFQDAVMITTSSKIYLFSSAASKWQVIDLDDQ